MNTIPLYEQDSFIKEFTACVVACDRTEQGYRIVLDQTAFFPEGGGQTADTGRLEWMPDGVSATDTEHEADLLTEIEAGVSGPAVMPVRVLDVQKEGEEIIHWTDGPLPVGSQVRGVLDWKERFSKMQHHSGEHIVSGLVNRHFGYHNVGFHLGSQVVTMDFGGVLTKEQLRQIEYEANEAVTANVPIHVMYPAKEELETLDYRSKIEIQGQVRIVEIPGYDRCACCAPHLHATGQIGLIKLVDLQHFRGGVRVSMLCGFAALADYNEKEDSVRAISQLLSAREDRVAEAVERVKQENYRQRGELMMLTQTLLDHKVAAVEQGTECVVMIEPTLEGNQPRELVNKLLERGVVEAWVFAGSDEAGYRYVVGSRNRDVRPVAKQLNEALQGRGGGKQEMVQGSVACTGEEIEAFFEKRQNFLKNDSNIFTCANV